MGFEREEIGFFDVKYVFKQVKFTTKCLILASNRVGQKRLWLRIVGLMSSF